MIFSHFFKGRLKLILGNMGRRSHAIEQKYTMDFLYASLSKILIQLARKSPVYMHCYFNFKKLVLLIEI